MAFYFLRWLSERSGRNIKVMKGKQQILSHQNTFKCLDFLTKSEMKIKPVLSSAFVHVKFLSNTILRLSTPQNGLKKTHFHTRMLGIDPSVLDQDFDQCKHNAETLCLHLSVGAVHVESLLQPPQVSTEKSAAVYDIHPGHLNQSKNVVRCIAAQRLSSQPVTQTNAAQLMMLTVPSSFLWHWQFAGGERNNNSSLFRCASVLRHGTTVLI